MEGHEIPPYHENHPAWRGMQRGRLIPVLIFQNVHIPSPKLVCLELVKAIQLTEFLLEAVPKFKAGYSKEPSLERPKLKKTYNNDDDNTIIINSIVNNNNNYDNKDA